MHKIFRIFLFWTLILCACSVIPASPQPVPTTATDALSPTASAPNPTLIATLSTPHIDQGPNGNIAVTAPEPQNCGYQWANQDLPELTSSFQASMQEIQPEAQANAYAFGENCILSDGSVGSFSAMETDFNVTLQVSDLADESGLGEWIVKVMQVVLNIPPDQIVGPQPGRVSLVFQSGGDQKVVNFYINQYQNLPAGLSGAEIYQALQTPQ